MKRSIITSIAVSVCVFVAYSMKTTDSNQDMQGKTIEGIWLGSLKLPNATELRMGITVLKNPDNNLSASLRIIDQNTGDIPCDEVTFESDILLCKFNHLGIEIEGRADLEGNQIEAEFRQRGAKFSLPLSRADELPKLKRPQEPQKPYPYMEEEVEFVNEKANVKLAGTFTYPQSGSPCPAVILLTGSGKQTRDVEAFGHKLFLVLADHLTRQGIAVLRADDRGMGGSTGNFEQSSIGDFAEDALAGVAYLKTRAEVDPAQIGLIGHSEGGITAPIAAAQCADVAFIVMMAGPGVGFDEAVIFQTAEQLKLQGTAPEDIELQRSWRKRLYSVFKENLDQDSLAQRMRELYAELSPEEIERMKWPAERLEFEIQRSQEPGWNFAMSYDPRSVLMRIKCPVLAINGEKDMQTTSKQNLSAIEAALQAGGNQCYTVKELSGLNHLFQTANTGSEYEYGRIEETMSPTAMQLISDWVLEGVRGRKEVEPNPNH